MANPLDNLNRTLKGLALICGIGFSGQSFACGGFFCSFVPINQAGEQIVFRQEGAKTTAMIKINYVGNAEDFGWVLPVPEIPDIRLGSDQIFTELELQTRPQFLLERIGAGCPTLGFGGGFGAPSPSAPASSGGSGVVIDKTVSVGPFDAQVVSSDDPQALAVWLADNNLDLTDQGSELLTPYIQAKSKFVVLKLKNGANSGSIQPIILDYQSNAPVIPMTLTAVAAQQNMGVLVWLLGEGRGVPKNFKHVTPNYTRLNWFNGTRAAYASYQNLITQAMDEAGGQGFATDFAGYMPELADQFTNSKAWATRLQQMESSSDAVFISNIWLSSVDALIQNEISLALPTSDAFIYNDVSLLVETFSAEQLKQARTRITDTIRERIIKPLDAAYDLFDDNLYLTRLYTTLSPDEMTKNPEFTFNTVMGDQPLARKATLTASCSWGSTSWTLKLGEGTGRDDELVIEAYNPVPNGPVATQQAATWQVENTSATADPVVVAKNDFQIMTIGEKKAGFAVNFIYLWLGGLLLVISRSFGRYRSKK